MASVEDVAWGLGVFGGMLLGAGVVAVRFQTLFRPSALPSSVALWLLMDGIIRLYDGLFGVLRPVSMEMWVFKPYLIYCQADFTYCDLKNAWMWTESYMDLWEITLGTTALWLASRQGQAQASRLLALVCTVMTCHKTCMYLLMEPMSDYASTGHNDFLNFWFIWFAPNAIWVVVPAYCVYLLWSELLTAPKSVKGA